MALIRSLSTEGNLVHVPYAGSVRGPVCMTCGAIVNEEKIVEGYPGESLTCKVLVRHHGAEELRTFHMESVEWDYVHLASMMARTNWFDPRSHEGAALGVRMNKARDHDEPPEEAA